MVSNLSDSFLRQFHYLRLSITDVCNFRCTYCLPNGYISRGKSKSKFLSLGEIRRLINAFSDLGVEKVRLTGGEPSLRRDLVKIITVVNENSTISNISMTTNGYRLKRDIKLWKEAGLTAINVSVDSLDARQFHAITGQNRFHQIMAGIDAAFEAGFQKVKVNTVLTRSLSSYDLRIFLDWIRTRPIQLRFIELMETGEGSSFFSSQHVSGRQVLDKLANQGWLAREKERNSGPAKVFSHPDYAGELGFIMPYSPDFCVGCNRLRVSAIGDLHLCLFSDQGIPLRDLLESDKQQGELEARISSSMGKKKASHFLHQSNTGMTQNFSYIGG